MNLNLPHQENTSNKEGFSVEEGYNICLLFFNELWPLIKPTLAQADSETVLLYEIFFLQACAGFDSSAAWSEAIYRVKKISKEEQKKGIALSEEDLFLCCVEFCIFYDELFELKLSYVVQLLNKLKIDPKNHAHEWLMWKRALKDKQYYARFKWYEVLE